MTGRDSKLLIAGMVAGVLLAALVLFFFRQHFYKAEPAEHNPSGAAQVATAPNPSSAGEAHSEMQTDRVQPGTVTGTLQLSAEEQQSTGVRSVAVTSRRLQREIVTVGTVEEAETQITAISARVGGRLDKLFLNFTGQPVQRGQRVALIYSPELVSTLEEYKLALAARQRLGSEAHEEAVRGAEELISASRRRLELWGVTADEIERLAAAPQPQIHVPILAASGGIVRERRVAEGQYVREGDVLYTVADLSTVWVIAEVYETDLPGVRIGQAVQITSASLPDTVLRGKISFIEPQVRPDTRTAPVRIAVPNPGMRLRPGMFVNATIRTPAREGLAIPRSAVLRAGTRDVVYVDKGDGVFEGRQVALGPPAGDMVPVLGGLQAGERVVTEGNFLIDSQTRITTGATGMFGGLLEVNGQKPAPAKPADAAEKYRVTFRTEPTPPQGAAENRFLVTVTTPDGKPVSDAQARVTLIMPAMPAMGMPEMRSSTELRWDGKQYSGTGQISMAGGWNVIVEVRRGEQLLATYRTQITAR